MALTGDPGAWADTFRDDLIPSILELVVSTWETLDKPHQQELEVRITQRFRAQLIKSKNLRRLPLQIDRQSVEDDLSTGEQKGEIDLRFTHGMREDVYFAFECKRLNVQYDSGLKSLASEYVEEGMMRFVSGRYGSNLLSGGMIGYVMDGKVEGVIQMVDNAVRARWQNLCLSAPVGLAPSSVYPEREEIKETTHGLVARIFRLHHIFLSAARP